MERRTFLKTGVAAGVMGVGGSTAFPSLVSASPRRLADGSIRMSSNENPLGVAPVARQAIVDGLDRANRYPGDSRGPLLEALARKHAVRQENLLLGNGSTEVLQMVVQVLGPEVRVVIADPTFEDVPRYAEPWSLHVEKVPLTPDYAHDLDRMHRMVRRWTSPVCVYVCNPNNPTATITPSAQVDAWIESAPDNVYFLVDEAYFEYAQDEPGYWSALKYIQTNPNVIVVRTFSKIYGMAGLRLGYGLAHEDFISRIGAIASSNAANHLALVAALASLGDGDIERRSLEVNERAKRVVHEVLDELDLHYLPSHTNFLMHQIHGDLRTYIDRMADAGLRVGRPFPPMTDYNRLSFSMPEHMEQFAETLQDFRRKGWV